MYKQEVCEEMTPEELEIWWQEEQKKIKPLPDYFFATVKPNDKDKSDTTKRRIVKPALMDL